MTRRGIPNPRQCTDGGAPCQRSAHQQVTVTVVDNLRHRADPWTEVPDYLRSVATRRSGGDVNRQSGSGRVATTDRRRGIHSTDQCGNLTHTPHQQVESRTIASVASTSSHGYFPWRPHERPGTHPNT